ncbi:MAG: carbohydrate binding family 9 domain-containing protein [Gemmatimonadetes bacterium]|nr:carbohydrate binding family 9 domain-containing protein [Gemmatimonadota bacterium]
MRAAYIAVFGSLLASVLAVPARGQDGTLSSTATTTTRGSETTVAARAARLDGSISIDGRLDDPAWLHAPVITGFVQGEPFEGRTPTEPTEVRVLFDDGSLYVAARMYESDPSVIRDQLVRRDERGAFDSFAVSLDPNRDGLTGYRFSVSAAGAESDSFLFGDVQDDEDWDAIWDSAVGRDDHGWTAELRVPLSQIRYEARPGDQTWGVNFTRRRLESNETDYFALESRTVRGRVSQFGTIEGIQVARASRRLEVTPFAVSQVQTGPSEIGDPLFDGSEFSPRMGTDVSMGIGSAFSLDATFNPDFGQVEVDPEVINLTAFETFFPEKRPFFVQDARVFDFAGGRNGGRGKALFFSRRIGREPRGSGPSEADFTSQPSQTTIVGAAKLTGRTSGGLSVGALAALTGRESGSAFFSDADSIGSYTAEPESRYGVLRLQQDFREGGSKIGVITTALQRGLPGDGSFDFLPSSAYSFGLDFEHQWGGSRSRDWRLWGFYSSSLVNGSTDALLDIQQSPIHYFQRPDADYLEVDSTATSLFGSDWRLQLERQNGEHWTWSTWVGQQSPGFEINDLGFITSGERLDVGSRIQYREIRPGRLFRSYNVNFFTFHNFRHSLLDDFFSGANWARSHESGGFFLNGNFTLLNNWGIQSRVWYSPQSQSDTQTRGGPLMTDPASVNVNFSVNTDRRAGIWLKPSVSYERSFSGRGDRLETELELNLRPSSSWEIELAPRYSRERDGAQYVSQSDASFYEPTFGDRYLFGDLSRRSLSMETRLNLTFSPDVSLQLFLQPLISSGDYLTYRQLERSESFDFIDFTEGTALEQDGEVLCQGGQTCTIGDTRYFDFDGDAASDFSTNDRDFNIRSLRGNAVFRWEYRPGSQIFLVWQHSRRDSLDIGDLDFGRDFDGLFAAPAENVFIVKVSQYLSF